MSSTAPSSGRTGFLFGNIDRQGRLEEDYLSDDAKDNLDHIGTKVTEKDRELNDIRNALPGDRNASSRVDDDDDDYDDDDDDDSRGRPSSQKPDDDDYYMDDDGLDDEDRSQLASRTLSSTASKTRAIDDADENYDEDDDNDDVPVVVSVTPAQSSLPRPPSNTNQLTDRFTQHSPSLTTRDPSRPTPVSSLPAHTPRSPTVRPSLSSPPKRSPPSTPKTQKHLFRTPSASPKRSPSSHRPRSVGTLTASPKTKESKDSEKERDDDPILFSQIFSRSPQPLNFARRQRRRLGVVVDAPQPSTVCIDEGNVLHRPPSPPNIDPVAVALEKDEPDRRLLYPPVPKIRPRVLSPSSSDDEDDMSAPLSSLLPKDSVSPPPQQQLSRPSVPAPFQVLSWEKNIQWGSSLPGDDADEQWFSANPDSPILLDSRHPASQHDLPSSNDVVNEPGNDRAAAAADEDDDDDGDVEFEDPVDFNPQPPAGNSQPVKLIEKLPATNVIDVNDDNDDDDDDDDMEWEDGNVTAAPSLPTQSVPSPQLISPLDSQNSVPRSMQKSNAVLSRDEAKKLVDKPAHGKPIVPKNEKVSGRDTVHEKEELSTRCDPLSKGVKEVTDIINTVLAPNQELLEGQWVKGIMWDSDTDATVDITDSEDSSLSRAAKKQEGRLILDLNDPNMIFEHLNENVDAVSNDQHMLLPVSSGVLTTDKMRVLLSNSRVQVHQLLQNDPFNISNDVYYVTGAAQHLKLDRVSIIRGLQNAPPATKIQTTASALSDAELLSFRRPKLQLDRLPKEMTVQALRRKRVKGGNAHIAGQIPKRKAELRCSEKDAYRVSVFEYALERQPCILPIPGMASRLCTYARKESAESVQRAVNAAAGTADADTIFMGPDEPPPLAAGNIEAGDKPLSVIESHVYTAPCAKSEAETTDFLLVRHGKNCYIREIDSLLSIGMTEPKIEVMTPNTDRYKKYSRERMVLWVMREFQRMEKEAKKRKEKDKGKGLSEPKSYRNPPYIEKDDIYNEFPRRRTYPETGLLRALKELSRFQNGKYVQDKEVAKKYNSREQDLLRILTPTETASFESMESAWGQIIERGIRNFTHPSGQGNILAAAEAERSGLEAGPAVGKYIKSHLLKTPWYRSLNMISAHRLQRKDLLQALSLARIVNDLKEGGEVMESKLVTLSPTEMNNVLTQVYRYNSKKIPIHPEEKRALIRELSQKKGKVALSPEVCDYPTIIRNVLKRSRDAGLSKGAAIAAMGTSMAGGTFLGHPLAAQRRALEDGDIEGLPAEADDFVPDENTAKILADYNKSVAKKKEMSGSRDVVKRGRPPGASSSADAAQGTGENDAAGTGQVKQNAAKSSSGKPKKGTTSGAENAGGANEKMAQEGNVGPEGSTPKTKKKLCKRLKVRKKVMNSDGTERVEFFYVTDPKEIERLLEKRNRNSNAASANKPNDDPSASGKLKIAIDLKLLQGGKAGLMKKRTVSAVEKSKGKTKSGGKQGDDRDGQKVVKKNNEKNRQIGKIKINTKKLHMNQEQAALKRKRSQYIDDIDYRAKKAPKTSRKKRNGTVELNGILERVEDIVRKTEAYVVPNISEMKIARLKEGESPPPGTQAKKLANPEGTGLDFTAPVDHKQAPHYRDIIKKQMFLNLVRMNCKSMKYSKASEFLDDIRLIVHNAKVFNTAPDVQWVVQHAELLLEVAVEEVSKRADEIRAAEAVVEAEKTDAMRGGAAGAGSKTGAKGKGNKSKGKSKGGSGDGKKGSEKKKKKKTPVKDTITILDDDSTAGVQPKDSKAEVVDLSGAGDGGGVDHGNRDEIEGVPSGPLDAGMTDDIFGMDVIPGGGLDGTLPNDLVLNLGDGVGGEDAVEQS